VYRVVIVDDHAAFRDSAAALLEADGFTIVGEAADGLSALALVARVRPQVVLLDVQLPDLDGFEVAARLAEMSDAPRIVLISSRQLSSYGRPALSNRVCGFVPKDALSGGTIRALVG
jgi:DNA-binding NarL/FixJ family response regulator